ncbi:MAG: SGNH/GDSL hydrolase family protein [Myxococcota bacterium]
MNAQSPSRRRKWSRWIAAALLVASTPAIAQDPPVCREAWGVGDVRVACLGNSNTQSDWQFAQPDGFPREEGWCERLADDTNRVTTLNCGWGGATASPNVSGNPRSQGAGQVEAALADPTVEIIILAFGTNDLGFSLNNPDLLLLDDPTPSAIADVIEMLAGVVENEGASVLVATTPYREQPTDPMLPPPAEGINDLVTELNNELMLRFESDQVIDFSSGFALEDFLSDGTHMSSSGMAKRAEAAGEAVLHLLPEPDPVWARFAALLVLLLRRRASLRRRLSPAGDGADRRRRGR